MTRELKLAVIVGFSLVLVVTVLISDHLSKARQVHLAEVSSDQPALVAAPVERSVTVPPPSEKRLAAAPGNNPQLSLGNAPSAMRADIIQGQGGGVIAGRSESPSMPGGTLDPDRSLITQLQQNGLEVVDRGSVREIIPRDPTAPETGRIEQAPATPTAPTATAAPERTHTVAEGDSLYKIAKQYYGDGMAWKKLGTANGLSGDSSLKIGAKIKLPPSEQITGKPTPSPVLATNLTTGSAPGSTTTPSTKAGKPAAPATKAPEPSKAKFASYTVKRGDTITEIARRQLGSPGRAGEVVRLNESQLEDEDTLQAGMVLKLPLS